MTQEYVDVLVIGAGPSGCVSASHLHNNGIKVKVVEKTKFPRLVVGESLIPRVMDHFAEAGLFESYDFFDMELNKPIPADEFKRDFKGYGFQ